MFSNYRQSRLSIAVNQFSNVIHFLATKNPNGQYRFQPSDNPFTHSGLQFIAFNRDEREIGSSSVVLFLSHSKFPCFGVETRTILHPKTIDKREAHRTAPFFVCCWLDKTQPELNQISSCCHCLSLVSLPGRQIISNAKQ